MTTPHHTTTAMPAIGEQAPQFTASAWPQGTVSLAAFAGKKNVVLAFYPKDDTPGCTTELCSFSDDLGQFQKFNTEVFGISCDTVESHASFVQKFSLQQVLLSDPDGAIARAYGVARPERAMANRVLFVIDKQGIVKHVVEGMPDTKQILEIIRSLS